MELNRHRRIKGLDLILPHPETAAVFERIDNSYNTLQFVAESSLYKSHSTGGTFCETVHSIRFSEAFGFTQPARSPSVNRKRILIKYFKGMS